MQYKLVQFLFLIQFQKIDIRETTQEETVKIINTAKSNMKENANAIELSTAIFEILSKLDKTPTDAASEILKIEKKSTKIRFLLLK